MDFEPPPPKQISARKRARISEFPRRIKTKSVGVPSARPPFGSFKTFLFVSGVVLRFRSNLLYQKFVNVAKRSPRAKAPLCSSTELSQRERAGKRSAHHTMFKKGVVCRNANAERERNFAKCWGFRGKYFAKFASRAS